MTNIETIPTAHDAKTPWETPELLDLGTADDVSNFPGAGADTSTVGPS